MMLYSTLFIIQAQSLQTRRGQLRPVKSVHEKARQVTVSSNHRFRSNLAKLLDFAEKIIMWQSREKVKMFYPFKFRELLSKLAT